MTPNSSFFIFQAQINYCLQTFSFLHGRQWKSTPLFEYELQPLTLQLNGILHVCIPVLLTFHWHCLFNFCKHLIGLYFLSWIWLQKNIVDSA